MYCTVQDVESYFHNRTFDCDGYLTKDKVEGFIANEAAFINGILGKFYVLPLVNTSDLIIFKMINELLVVGTIDDIDRSRTDDGKFDHQRNARQQAMDMIQKILDGFLVLEVAPGSEPVMKFNNIDSRGNEVVKRFSDSNIEPYNDFYDREHHRYRRVN